MAINAKDVMNLRQRTGVAMMDCKQALTETNGNMDAAVALLRERLKGKMDERTAREANEGVIAVAKSSGGGHGSIAIVELVSETDFAARNENFVAAAGKIAHLALHGHDGEVPASDAIKHIVDELRITIKENISFRRGHKLSGSKVGSYVHHNRKVGVILAAEGDITDDLLTGLSQHVTASVPVPTAVDETGLPAEELAKVRGEYIAEAQASGKPAQIAEKMATGRIRKWVDEHTLMGQVYIRELDAKKPVRDYVPKGTKVLKFVRYELGA